MRPSRYPDDYGYLDTLCLAGAAVVFAFALIVVEAGRHAASLAGAAVGVAIGLPVGVPVWLWVFEWAERVAR